MSHVVKWRLCPNPCHLYFRKWSYGGNSVHSLLRSYYRCLNSVFFWDCDHISYIVVTIFYTGSWSNWREWTACDLDRNRRRVRTCSDPAPSCGGAECAGDKSDSSRCCVHPGIVLSVVSIELYLNTGVKPSGPMRRQDTKIGGCHMLFPRYCCTGQRLISESSWKCDQFWFNPRLKPPSIIWAERPIGR